MKLSKRQLKRIIREEKQRLLEEAPMESGYEKPERDVSGWNGSYGGSEHSVREGQDVMELVADQFNAQGITAPQTFWDRLEEYINDVEDAVKDEIIANL